MHTSSGWDQGCDGGPAVLRSPNRPDPAHVGVDRRGDPPSSPSPGTPSRARGTRRRWISWLLTAVLVACLVSPSNAQVTPLVNVQATPLADPQITPPSKPQPTPPGKSQTQAPYGQFPKANDPFHYLPCTSKTNPPKLDDPNPDKTWAALYDSNPDHWTWGLVVGPGFPSPDKYAGRGLYLCGYLDVPLDYTTADRRIVRLAITTYRVWGAARTGYIFANPLIGRKTLRTIVVNPGGPGGSGTNFALSSGEAISRLYSDGQFDVLGWDPRGLSKSQPAVSCLASDAKRDRWQLFTAQSRASSHRPRYQLEIADAYNEAVFRSCWERQGDLGRFLTTAFVARDVDEIRKALGEDELTAFLISYGTGIGQTYAGMFPDKVGRIVMDGPEYVRDHRVRGGFGVAALDNATDAWRDGFLGECLKAGPDRCALAQSRDKKPVTLQGLMDRMTKLIGSLADHPVSSYSAATGPSVITHMAVLSQIYGIMYYPRQWPYFARALWDLEGGNSTEIAALFDRSAWRADPKLPCPGPADVPSDSELSRLVVCSDSYDAPEPNDAEWWVRLWDRMTKTSWIAGDPRFYVVFPCKRFSQFWPRPAEVFRGPLPGRPLRTPVMLVAEPYDPATSLRNGRRLLAEMGKSARMVVHHGYGHSSLQDPSACTNAVVKAYMLYGKVPDKTETDCYADEKPYLYGVKPATNVSAVATAVAAAASPATLGEGGGFQPMGWRRQALAAFMQRFS
ncbi:Alpha/Beta hydrolase protein [Podospora conica]|nr:Alpha/Beta hydrolase protein [Schizothecium conicum]